MTEKTASFSVRVPIEVKKILSREMTRKCFEGIARQIERGEVQLSGEGVASVNTTSESVNTDCDNCPYMDDLDMSKFNEVCEFKGLDRQKALDRCVQMLWR